MSNVPDGSLATPPRRRALGWPGSLASRTLVTLLFGLALVQGLGLTIHAYDSIGLQHFAEARYVGVRISTIVRAVTSVPPEQRAGVLRELDLPSGWAVTLDAAPASRFAAAPPLWLDQVVRISIHSMQPRPDGPPPPRLDAPARPGPPPRLGPRPHGVIVHCDTRSHKLEVAVHLPEDTWLNVRLPLRPVLFWNSPTFLAAFVVMTLAAALLSVWAVRRLIGPVATLAAAAERLGRDVNASPLPEVGPSEVRTAAIAFNTMASRIRRFVQDRTFLIAAIGHDLRTPITRMKLRAEFIEDDELRGKFLADLDELEAMVAATLAFGRDASRAEPVVALDLPALLRTVVDEASDATPQAGEQLRYDGPEHMVVQARPVALKRAIANLVGNAVKYAGGAQVALRRGAGTVTVFVDDDGPGIPPDELERVFDPFYRVEGSRNRETGGTGLGLSIARNILRAHGGDVVLGNRSGQGTRATITLPA